MDLNEILESVNYFVDNHEQNNLNSELRDLLIDNLFSKGSNIYNTNYNHIENYSKDINKYIKKYSNYSKGILIESITIYRYIKDPDLRYFFIINYYDMKVHADTLDILEFSRKLYIQIEACLNYVISESDAFNKIRIEPKKYYKTYYSNYFKRNVTDSLSEGRFSFFDENGDNKSITYIDITAKLFYANIELGIGGYDFKIWKEIKDNRNEASHGLTKGGYRKYEYIYKINTDDTATKKNKIDTYYDFFFYKILHHLNCLMR